MMWKFPGKLRISIIVLTAILILVATGPSFAQGEKKVDWKFSIGSGLDFTYGTAFEYVYDSVTNNKVSELDWDLKPLVSIASVATADFGKGEISLSCAAGFPGKTGTVTDSDWLNESLGDTSTKTNYSASDALASSMIDLALSLRYTLSISSQFDLEPSFGYRYMRVAWSANGGWLQYAGDYSSTASPPFEPYTTGPVQSLYGLLSTYEQSYSALILGFSAKWRPSNHFSIAAGIQASPAVSSTALDNHVLRGLSFTDKMSGGYLLEPDLAFDWSPDSRLKLRLHCRYTIISGLRGDTTETAATNVDTSEGLSPGQSLLYANSAGAALETFGIGLIAFVTI